MRPQLPLTVSQLNRHVRLWLEHELGDVIVSGELSNLSRPASGHYYFSLKDSSAQLRCVFFKTHHSSDSGLFKNGQQVTITGKLSIYEARGDYQLIARTMTPAGIGELYQQYEHLKLKLEQQGLFNPACKKPLPRFPTTIAIITSASGAALHDILTTLSYRYPIANVAVYPSEVQGRTAAMQLINAILRVNQECYADVILLARGGGSIEDLWPFNDEQLALTISRSLIPIVSGVGHETDFTIADFVADLRAATPTAAAQAVTPDKAALIDHIKQLIQRLRQTIDQTLKHYQVRLSYCITRRSTPLQLLARHTQTIDYLEQRLHQAMAALLHYQHHRYQQLVSLFTLHHPIHRLKQTQSLCLNLEKRLHNLLQVTLKHWQQRLLQQLAVLHAVGPLATLGRGYAIATYNNTVLFNTDDVNINDNIKVTLANGTLYCSIISKGVFDA